MSESDEWPRERYPERLRIHGIGRAMTWAGSELQEPWQEIIGYEDGEDDAPESAVPYIRADVVDGHITTARAEERKTWNAELLRKEVTANVALLIQHLRQNGHAAAADHLASTDWAPIVSVPVTDEDVAWAAEAIKAMEESGPTEAREFTERDLAAARAEEREACAQLVEKEMRELTKAEERADKEGDFYFGELLARDAATAHELAAAIRAHGEGGEDE